MYFRCAGEGHSSSHHGSRHGADHHKLYGPWTTFLKWKNGEMEKLRNGENERKREPQWFPFFVIGGVLSQDVAVFQVVWVKIESFFIVQRLGCTANCQQVALVLQHDELHRGVDILSFHIFLIILSVATICYLITTLRPFTI